jgi:hypothetical protein
MSADSIDRLRTAAASDYVVVGTFATSEGPAAPSASTCTSIARAPIRRGVGHGRRGQLFG